MSFTLKVDSGSWGSGLDGTESGMSWSDTFSSFYQRTKPNQKLQLLAKTTSLQTCFQGWRRIISPWNLLQCLTSHHESSFFSLIGKPPLLQHVYRAWIRAMNGFLLLTKLSERLQLCQSGLILHKNVVKNGHCVQMCYIRKEWWCYVILKASFPLQYPFK